MIQVNLQCPRVDVELPLSDVPFMLKVRIINPSALRILLDLLPFDPEYLHTIGEEQPIIKDVKFNSLHLLDIAVELLLLPFRKADHTVPCFGLLYTLQDRFFRDDSFCLLLNN